MRSPNLRSALKVMSAPSPRDGRLCELDGICDQTGVSQSDVVNNAIKALDFGEASFKVG
jgi:hypothetical protein